ncbi:MAG: glycosyltransferase [Prevotellaceae bacterium]|jgi:glycosyltransferase involved in cell wall biosynthesis|nr:glycosyltransferase [Prevotellaceae bacterium]
MKILHIIVSLKTGGAETMLIDMVNAQVNRHEVSLCIINSDYETEMFRLLDKRVKMILLHRRPGTRRLSDLIRLNYQAYFHRYDVIHGHDTTMMRYLRFRLRPHVLTVLTVHDTRTSLRGIGYYDVVVSISVAVRNMLAQHGLVSSPVVYNGIRPEQLEPATRRFSALTTTIHLVQVGRLVHEKKGQHLSIQALALLAQKLPHYHVYLDFIGEGDSLAYLEALGKALGVADRIRFLGKCPREQVYTQLKEYDLLLQPSLFEGFGLTVVEAMTVGIPVLISDIEGPMEIIHNGKFGFCFAHNDAEAMADKLDYMLTHKAEVEAVADVARKRAELFTVSSMVLNYEQIYLKK